MSSLDIPPDDAFLTEVRAFLACPTNQMEAWLANHPHLVSRACISAIKHEVDNLKLSDPVGRAYAERAMLIASALPDDPLALPLALWTKGNAEMYLAQQAAIESYEQALPGYRTAGDPLDYARILSNLLFLFADSGYFDQGEAAYQEARPLILAAGENAARYDLFLEMNYAWLLHCRGDYLKALELHDRNTQLAEQLEDEISAYESRVNQALTLGMLGRLDEGLAILLQQHQAAQQHGEHLTVARIEMDLGMLLTRLGQPGAALRHFSAARQHFHSLDENHQEIGSVLLYEAELLAVLGAQREARRSYTQAHLRLKEHGLDPYAVEASIGQAVANRLSGGPREYQQAARLLDDAEKCCQQHGYVWGTMQIHLERVELSLAQQDSSAAFSWLQKPLTLVESHDLQARWQILRADAHALHYTRTGDIQQQSAAQQNYQQVLTYAQSHHQRWLERRALAGLGKLVYPDHPAVARHYFTQVMEHDDLTRRTLTVEELKASFQHQVSEVPLLLVELLADQQQAAQALTTMWRTKGAALLDLFHRQDEDNTSRIPLDVQTELSRVRQQLAARRWQIARESTGVENEQRHQREIHDATLQALEKRWFELRCQRTQYWSDHDQHLLHTPADLLSQMDADLLIEYLHCGRVVVAVCADRSGQCRVVRLPGTSRLHRILSQLNLKFTSVVVNGAPPEKRLQHHDEWIAECLPLLERCYHLLLEPLELPPDGARLLISPHDYLHLFPFAAFWDGRQYMVERYDIEMILSGALLAAPPPPP
ncbi:MAG: hypothetical protein HC884_06505, partial [Chloroflexaceae bacterium]|nr:hypothetical protein [Chloroflexaceae bacterium]